MSVLEYIYPRDSGALKIDTLLPKFQNAVSGVSIAELDRKPRAMPDWSMVLVSHPGSASIGSMFSVVAQSKANKSDLRTRYEKNEHLPMVQRARHLIWSQLKIALSVPERKIDDAIDIHYMLLAAMLRQCDGLIDLPENGKLYTSIGFSRHAARVRHQ